MKKHITQEQYNILNWEQKLKIQKLFNIKPSAEREIVNNEVKFDGVVAYDLEVINIGNMIEVIGDSWQECIKDWGTENLCDQLWDRVLDDLTETPDTSSEVKIPEEPEPEPVNIEDKPKKDEKVKD